MRKFRNDIGLSAEFEETIPFNQILERLKWLGSNWKEVDDNNLPLNENILFEKER